MFTITIRTPAGEQKVDVTRDCFRFGKTSDIAIPVAEDHCATVYRRNGQLHFSNRSTRSCKLGRQSVNQNESVVWKTGKTVELGDGVSMVLSITSKDNRNIGQFLSLEKAKKAVKFNESEDQIVSDKVVAMLCAGLLFYSLTLL
ncbi:hypothetical protein N9Y42_03080 [Mariniblastus sp.]|nr:hypothetical protein [Mariniblastus sp.]